MPMPVFGLGVVRCVQTPKLPQMLGRLQGSMQIAGDDSDGCRGTTWFITTAPITSDSLRVVQESVGVLGFRQMRNIYMLYVCVCIARLRLYFVILFS